MDTELVLHTSYGHVILLAKAAIVIDEILWHCKQ